MGSTGPFTAIPNIIYSIIPVIGKNCFVVYSYLQMRANKDNRCWPSYDIMQKELDMSRAVLAKALRELQEYGLISTKKRYSNSVIYTVISSENELLSLPLVQKMNYISSENELPEVQKMNPNKNQRTRIKEQESEPDEFETMRSNLEELLGIPATNENDIKTIREAMELGIIRDDIKMALEWRKENGLGPVKYLGGIIGGAKTQMLMRRQNGKEAPKEVITEGDGFYV